MRRVLFILFISIPCFAQSIGENNNKFALSLLTKLERGEENLVFSPYSIFSNLTLLSLGAEGVTKQEILSGLHISTNRDLFLQAFHKQLDSLSATYETGYQLSIANGLFPNKGSSIESLFEKSAEQIFNTEIKAVDYTQPHKATGMINHWIGSKTKDKIPHLVEESDIDSSTELVIANAVYFEGKWAFPFLSKATHKETFYPENAPPLQTMMMEQTESFSYFENEKLQGIILPFERAGTEQPLLECILILPKESSNLKAVEATLNEQTIGQWLRTKKKELVHLQLPKFCFSLRIPLSEPLKELGIESAFTRQADFSKINGKRNLYLQKVLHETYCSLNEIGVTAASATTSHIGLTSKPPLAEPAISFIANHPFLFMIVDYHSGTILFLGHIHNPPATCT